MHRTLITLVSGFLLLTSVIGAAGELRLAGSLGGELRWFPDDPAWPDQLDGRQLSLVIEPELSWRSENRRHLVTVEAFARLDGGDDERTHVDLREASWRFLGNDIEVLAGVHKVYWGVTESRHLVDLINQVDLVEDADEEDRLGQPMVSVAVERDWGRLEGYLLLGFRERTFPGIEGRLRPPLPVDTDRPIWQSDREDSHLDWALRWSHVLGDVDLGLHLFHGTGREPALRLDAATGQLRPEYRIVDQAGLDVQWTREAWLWKLEAITRSGQGSNFQAVVAGFEWTLYQLAGSAADLGILVEYLYDGRDQDAPVTSSDDDVFAGVRFALNDIQDTSLLAGVVLDRSTREVAGRLEVARRIGDHLVLELEGWLFSNVGPEDSLAPFAQDSSLTLRGTWHF